MTGEIIGLVTKEVKLVKKNEELTSKIMEHRKISEDKAQVVFNMMRYNMWTIKQFCDLTGYVESSISNMMRPKLVKGEYITHLDHCFPFQSLEKDGLKFIVRNEKSEKLLPKVE